MTEWYNRGAEKGFNSRCILHGTREKQNEEEATHDLTGKERTGKMKRKEGKQKEQRKTTKYLVLWKKEANLAFKMERVRELTSSADNLFV